MALNESFLVLALLFGGGRADLLSLVDAGEYFKARGVVVAGDAIFRLAGSPGKDGAGEVAQLLAIRTLGNRKDGSAKATLEEVARTQKGFAKEYAQAALAAIAGRPPPNEALPKDYIRKDALAWFPADTTIALAAAPGAATGLSERETRDAMSKVVPKEGRRELYDFADKVGNVRIDRFAFGYNPESKDSGRRFMLRLTGRANKKRMLAALKDAIAMGGQNVNLVEEGDVTRVETGIPFFTLAFAGDSDVIFATGDGLPALLAVRAGQKPSFLKGAFSRDLAGVSENAYGLLIGSVFEQIRRELVGSPLGIAPNNFLFEVGGGEDGLRIRARAEFDSAEDAKAAVAGAEKVKAMGLEDLGKDNAIPGAKPEQIKLFRTALESLTFKQDGSVGTAEIRIPRELPRVMMELLIFQIHSDRGE